MILFKRMNGSSIGKTNRYSYLFLLLFLFFIVFSVIGNDLLPKREMRAIWLTTNYALDWPKTKANGEKSRIKQQRELIYLLDRLQAANFNVVLFQTRLRGDVLYPSKIETWSSFLSGKEGTSPGYDPLEFVIQECHKRGMECHAWFVTIPLGAQAHVKKMGKQSIANRKPQMCKSLYGEYYLNPGHPDTAPYLLSLVKEIVSQYDVDGIHLDYIRYPDRGKDFPDKNTYKESKSKLPIEQWRRKNIDHIVYTIYDWIKKEKPWVKLSSAPLGRYKNMINVPTSDWTSFEAVYQDTKDWLQQGKHDFIIPMMYAKDHFFFPYVFDWQSISNGRPVIPGIAVYKMDPSEKDWALQDISQQIDFTRFANNGGQAYYRTQNVLNDKKGFWNMLCKNYYLYPALLPKMNWADSIPPLSPANFQSCCPEKRIIQFSWESNPEEQELYPLSYTIYGFPSKDDVSLESPQHILATGIRNNSYTISLEEIEEKGMNYFVITACDKYYNESNASEIIPLCTTQ